MSEPKPPGIYPMDRARYSANPAFKEGADQPHPIDTLGKSLLARPEVAEALEAVFITGLYETGSEPAAEINDNPIDHKLARTGLKWLRNELGEDSDRPMRERVIVAKSRLNDMEHSAEQEAERQRARVERERQEKAEREAAARAEETAATERTREEARQADYRTKFERAATAVGEKHPDLSFDGIFGLIDELEIIDETGEPVVRQKRGFQARLAERVASYMEHPEELRNDAEALLLAADWAANEADEPLVVKYGEAISAASSRLVDSSFYRAQNLSTEIAREWLGMTVSEAPVSRRPFGRKNKSPEENMPAASFGKGILTRTLERAARDQPQQLLDVVHVIAEAGFDSADADMRARAASFLSGYLYGDALAANILFISTVSRNPKTQRIGVDLYETLKLIGSETAVPHGQQLSRMGAEMSQSDLRIFAKCFGADIKPHGKPGPGFADVTSRVLDHVHEENIEKFMNAMAADPEGMADTLYARVSKLK